MSRIRLLFVSMLGVVALGAISSTAANAEPTVACPALGTDILSVICIQNLAGELLVLGLPTEDQISILSIKELEANGTTTPSELNFNGVKVECSEAANEGTVDGLSNGSILILKLFIRFTGCIVGTATAECEVVSLPSGAGLSGVITTLLIDADPEGLEDGNIIFLPEEANFAEFRIKSKGTETCAQAQAPARVEGSILGLLLNPEEDQESHLLDFENAGGPTFLLNKTEAHLTLTEELFLDKPANWGSTWNEHPPWGLFLSGEV